MRRTLVEFYDRDYLENVLAVFGAGYDAVYYFHARGEAAPTEEDRRRLTEFLQNRLGLTPRFVSFPPCHVGGILERFEELASGGGRLDLDITGGSPTFIAAAGYFAAQHWEEAVCLCHYDPDTGTLTCGHPTESWEEGRPIPLTLTVPEAVLLGGGAFLSDDPPPRHDLEKQELRSHVLRLWDAVKDELRSWNTYCALPTPDRMPKGRMGKVVESRHRSAYERVTACLRRAGLLSDEWKKRSGENTVATYRLNVPENALFLYDKAGNVLEMLSCLAAVDSGAFADWRVGVTLDWDGRLHHEGNEPYNEIDLLLTCGHLPVFVSCKGTRVENEYLYEIATMARHFGGPHAKAVLISGVRNRRSIHRRAEEMGVLLLDNVCEGGAEGLTEQFRAHFSQKEAGQSGKCHI